MNSNSEGCVVEPDNRPQKHELSIATRFDRSGITTYHVIERDHTAGIQLEKIYDGHHRLLRIETRTPSSNSSTSFDIRTGERVKNIESSTLNDGSALRKEILYAQHDRAVESICVVAPNGTLVRKVERRFLGSRTTYQGQTEYDALGEPALTVNHSLDHATGCLLSRQQIKWLREGQRQLVESFSFDQAGGLRNYSRVLYHVDAGPFIEEIQWFDSRTQCLLRRTVRAFDRNGNETASDVLTYNEVGEVSARRSRFCDRVDNYVVLTSAATSGLV